MLSRFWQRGIPVINDPEQATKHKQLMELDRRHSPAPDGVSRAASTHRAGANA